MSVRRKRRDLNDFNSTLKDARRYLRYRIRSKNELGSYLKKRGHPEEIIENVLKKLEDEGILDDEKFAYLYTLDSIRLKFKGPRIVKKELKELGVDEEIVQEAIMRALNELDLVEILSFYSRKLENLDERALRNYLYSRGFEQEQIEKIEELLRSGGE